MNLFERHIELLEAVNTATTERRHWKHELVLNGFRDALKCMDINQLIECDMHYINKGIDRPMCCGVFLDWEPK